MDTYNEFVSLIKNDGLARQNRFYVFMTAPAIKGEYAAVFAQASIKQLLMLCKGVSIPGVNVSTVEHRTTGEVTNVPYDRNFGDASFIFYVDRQMIVRKLFDDWINAIQNPKTRVMGWYSDLISDIEVFVVPRSEEGAVYKIVLHDCMPKSIGGLTLDQANNDIMALDVNIEYRYYTTELIAYTPVATVQGPADTYRYIPPPVKNGIPGVTVPYDSNNQVAFNPLSILQGDYTQIYQSYASNFLDFQNSLGTGESIFNNVSIPLDINGALGTLKEQAIQTVKSAVVNSIFGGSGVKIK